jgi:hypothetical protein
MTHRRRAALAFVLFATVRCGGNVVVDGGPTGASGTGGEGAGGECPDGEYLLIPCCGGDNDTACSNGSGPPAPAPYCVPLPASCAGDAFVGGCSPPGTTCSGGVDAVERTISCVCI